MGEGAWAAAPTSASPGCQSQGAYLGRGSRQWCRAALERMERSLLGSGRRRLRTGDSANPSSLGSPCRLWALRGPWEQVSALEAPSPPPPPRRAPTARRWRRGSPGSPSRRGGDKGGRGCRAFQELCPEAGGGGSGLHRERSEASGSAPPPPPEAQAGGLTGCSADGGGSGGGGGGSGGGAPARPGLQPYKGCPAHPRPAPPRC